jgi:phenylacetyl-CoA:acceptor oxidoreductase subunit 2
LSQPATFKLLAPVLAGLGFLTLTVEAGRPLRGWHLWRHLRRSWMSRETVAGVVFILAAILDWLFPHPALWALAAAAAMGLMVSHGCILYRVRAVAAWHVCPVPLLFLTSGFTMGSGLVLLASPGEMTRGIDPVLIGLVCVVLDAVTWFLYLRWSHDTAFLQATKPLRRTSSLIFTVGTGHLLPALLLLLLLAVPAIGGGVGMTIVAALAGLAIMVGGVSQKAGIVLSAGYPRGIVLGRRGK